MISINKKNQRTTTLYFLVPLLVLSILLGWVTYSIASKRINDTYQLLENSTMNIADSYSKMLINSKNSSEIINNLLVDKALLAGEAILLLDNVKNNELADLAEKYQLWQINLFNNKGKIIASNIKDYIGWESYDGHPVESFIQGDEDILIEDSRKSTESGLLFKYIYIRDKNKSFVQVGILDENIQKLTEDFQTSRLIDEILKNTNIQHVFFIDMESRIIASSMKDLSNSYMQDSEIISHLFKQSVGTERHSINGKDALHVYSPILKANEQIGMLSIIWKTTEIDNEIKGILLSSLGLYLVITLIISTILYYAYKKDTSNFQIAYYDKLTGLPNEQYLKKYLEQTLLSYKKSKFALLLLNLTNFKLINSTYGFKFGDSILIETCNSIKKSLNLFETLFRFNADRFALIIENYEDPESLKDIAMKILESQSNIFKNQLNLEYLKLEIAIVEVDDQNARTDKILQKASFLLNEVIPYSNESIVFYNHDIEDENLKNTQIEKILIDTIEEKDKDSFFLEFQPKFDIKKNKIIGFEALSRLKIDGLGFISPLNFIDLAEKRMLLYGLGKIVLEKSCEFLKELEYNGYMNIGVSVNISASQLLREEFIDDVIKIINIQHINLNLLEFEITETVLLTNYEVINKKLETIRKLGISISIDDFGTGYSSFSRLSNLYIDIVKIDKCFIDSILTHEENNLILSDIISMAHKLDLKVVAEGVEEEKQKTYLEKYDCDLIQGYLISRPVNSDLAMKLLES